MRKKRNIIIISIALVILIVLGLVIFLQIFNNVDNVTKVANSETSKLEAGNVFKDAYFDEETGTVKGLTSDEQKVFDEIMSDLKNYLSANGIYDDIEEVTENQIKLKLTDADEETVATLKDDIVAIITEQLKENVGDVVTEDMITAVETNESLSNEIETGLGDVLANLGGDLSTFAQAGIYNELDDEIEEQISRFIISDIGKNMVDDILSGNGADILTNFGDDLLGSVRGGLNDFMDFKITEELFGNVGGELTSLLSGKLNIVGKVGDIIGLDLDGIVGLPDKLIGGITGKATDLINNNIGGDLIGGITGGLDNYIGSLGGGITSSITGSISEILTGDSFTLLDSTVLKQVNYPSDSMSLEQISYERLSTDPSLLCAGHGVKIPSVKSSNEMSEEDATLFVPPLINKQQWPDVIPGTIVGSVGHQHINLKSGDNLIARNEQGYWVDVNPVNPLRRVQTRTIARYNSYLRKGTVAESYILAHEKNTAYYADYVQAALWYLLGQTNGKFGVDPQPKVSIIGNNLCQEAIGLQEAVIAQEAFVASNMGKKIVDQTNYWMNNG